MVRLVWSFLELILGLYFFVREVEGVIMERRVVVVLIWLVKCIMGV